MKILHNLLLDIRENLIFYLLAFSLLASTIVFIPNGMQIYLLGLVYLFYNAITNQVFKYGMAKYFIPFLISCIVSILIASAWNYRIVVFIATIIACTSFCNSYKLFAFRKKYLWYCLNLFPILSMGALFCYYAGINMFVADEETVSWDFSAFFPHPMWLGAAVGVANVVLAWHIFNAKKQIKKYLYILLLLASLFVSVIAASRTALFASLAAMLVIVYAFSKSIGKLIKIVLVVGIISSVSLPYYISNSQRMVAKFEAGKESTYGSRTERWETQYKHFADSPITGSGFSVNYYGNSKVVGRSESGSGWLSILFQTGILGAMSMLLTVFPAIRNIRYLKSSNFNILVYSTFCFLCLHSITEGYILTTGYYLCILFWTELGYIMTLHKYKNNECISKH